MLRVNCNPLFSALTLEAVKLVLKEMAAFHATAHHYIQTYPGQLDALAKEQPRVPISGLLSCPINQPS